MVRLSQPCLYQHLDEPVPGDGVGLPSYTVMGGGGGRVTCRYNRRGEEKRGHMSSLHGQTAGSNIFIAGWIVDTAGYENLLFSECSNV